MHGEENAMRRVLQVCGVAAVLASLVGVHVPATGAQGIVSGIIVPPISAVTPGMPVGVTVSVPSMVSQPIMPGISVGMAGTGSGSEGHVTHTETRTSEPATIVLSE
jgi:hypothetical protein